MLCCCCPTERLISALPNLATWLCAFFSGWVSDWLIRTERISINVHRKLFTSFGAWALALGTLLGASLGENSIRRLCTRVKDLRLRKTNWWWCPGMCSFLAQNHLKSYGEESPYYSEQSRSYDGAADFVTCLLEFIVGIFCRISFVLWRKSSP